MTDALTKDWIRNAGDDKAAAAGCRFDMERARHAVDWIEDKCYLYEGECAGKRIVLQPWQKDFVMRFYGWVKFSPDWNREIRRFSKASVWVPKKNGKSPLLAANGLYLLCADGEQGQKIYSSARDGKQAMISHQHAMEMVRRSPELSDECDINKTTGRITHEPTRSFYQIIAGDNINSQEGLNGSVMVDETHVVNRALMKVLEYAGASRSEPVHMEFSTAGNNPDGYGKSQYDKGADILSGKTEAEGTLFISHEATQDIADVDLDTNIVAVGKKANPAWGYTIKESEFIAKYNEAKSSISDLLDFKMYRLNIWQRSSSPWIRASDWAKCARKFDIDDMAGQSCWAALDLSLTRDMTALSLIFHGMEPETWRLLTLFWMPENYARANAHQAPFMEWVKSGHLILTPGDTTDYGFIKGAFRDLCEKVNIQELAFDRTYAEKTTQELSEGSMDNKGNQIEPGTGVARVEFKQDLMTFAEPTADFERDIIAGRLHHNDNPVLNWQIGHVQVYRDVNGNKRPVKPDGKKDSVKKIDGVVTAIMAKARAKTAPEGVPGIYIL